MVAIKKTALGRGLGALIDDAEKQSVNRAGGISEIDLDKIQINPFQPREKFDEDALTELAASIRELGLIQPITVREIQPNQYQIISGERRTRAAKLAGLTKIPAFIRKANDTEMLEMALVENIQREDLNPIEIALSYNRLLEECNLTQETLSERVGKKRSTVSNYLRLLKLPAEIQKGIQYKKISMGHAKALISLEKSESQIRITNDIIEKDLSVRQTEEMVRLILNPPPKNSRKAKTEVNETYKELKNHLEKYFGNKIDFTRDNNGKGKIVIPFKSDVDLEKIIAVFDRLNP
jgi:ParB family transcriptional regulator, chromosome partitioning protein